LQGRSKDQSKKIGVFPAKKGGEWENRFTKWPSPEQYALPSRPNLLRSFSRPVIGSPMYLKILVGDGVNFSERKKQ
jgi:hypothetical protein